MAEEVFTGFAWGIVTKATDPDGLGRIRARIPGLFEEGLGHPEWIYPIGWPGGGQPEWGSQYPVKVRSQVAVFFEHGDIDASPVYLPGPYGQMGDGPNKGQNAGPSLVREAVDGKDDGEKTVVIWEDDTFEIFITMYNTADDGKEDRRLVMREKKTGSGFTLNATDGGQSKSVTMDINVNTSLNIQCNGIINIEGTTVQIQGRKVVRKPGVTTI
jgi:hypothetical protein